MENKTFLSRIRRYQKNDTPTWDKGIEIHDTIESAKQAYHAYLGAYAYGHNADTNYVYCSVMDMGGYRLLEESWTQAPADDNPEE